MAADFGTLARQYWEAWGEALRGSAAEQPGDAARMAAQAWQDMLGWWTRQAPGNPSSDDVLMRFNRLAGEWYARMQQLAAQFAGREAGAAEVARAWKEVLGGAGGNVFAGLLGGMDGRGLQGFGRWYEEAKPWLQSWLDEGRAWLRMPAFGFTREHQERLQALAAANLECQEATAAFDALLAKASEDAFAAFERLLEARGEQGRPVTSARELFDLWVDAAEEAYAAIALSKEFRTAYGRYVDAMMRLRAGVQKEVELACATLGMPTRTEMDAAHRKIAGLERALRRMRGAPGDDDPVRRAVDGPAPAAAKRARKKPVAKRAAVPGAGKPGAKKPRPAPARAESKEKRAKAPSKPAPRASRARASRAVRVARTPVPGFANAIPEAPKPLPRGRRRA